MFKDLGVGALIFLGALAFTAVVCVGAWVFTVATADIKGRGDAHIRINSADTRIPAYERFFNLCTSIQTLEASLDASFAELRTANTNEDKARVSSNITGQTTARAEAINSYNNDARKSYTIGQFRSSELPYQIPTTTFTEGYRTSC